MRIAFIDFSGWDYTVDTPYRRPLGGSHSALCYLAEELARLGHTVTLLNNVAAPTVARGVAVARIDGAGLAGIAGADAVVVLNGCATDRAAALRRALGDGPLFVYWTQHADDQPASANLHDPAMRALWDAFVLISDWQAERYRAAFGLPEERTVVLRNAVGPAFRGLFPAGRGIRAERPWPPVLAYTSTPFRGLEVLVDAFPRIRAAIPGTTLKVFSSMAVYQVERGRDGFADLYDRCRTTEGIDYVGSLPQPELARALRGVTALAYPNTFPETSCIAVMEALAAGCLVVTSTLGALPETLSGFGFPMAPPADRGTYAERFADLAVRVLRLVEQDPDRAERHLADQVDHVDSTMTWTVRARQWSAWLAERVAGRRAAVDAAPLAARIDGCVPVAGPYALSAGRSGLYLSDGSRAEGRALQRHGEPDGSASRLLCALLRPCDTVIEIGAGLGTTTVPLARQVGAGGLVVAVEPRPDRFPLLCATLALNGLAQVRPLPALPAAGIAALLCEPAACRLLRIDTGGGEELLLEQAGALLERCRTILFCRVGGAATFEALAALARRFDHRLYWQGHRDGGDASPPSVHILGVPSNTLLAIDGIPATGFAEAAGLFPGFTPDS